MISFGSFILTPEQRKYGTTRKKLLAVVRFTRQYRHYLLGKPFKIRTDHSSLTWLLRFKNADGQLARWLEELSQYDMTIVHRKGKIHSNADGLSRIPDTLNYCDNYKAGIDVSDLPCAMSNCQFCKRAQAQWSRFEEEVDNVIPLAKRRNIRRIQLGETWIEDYTRDDLETMKKNDADISKLLIWMATEEPSQFQLKLSSPAVRYFWTRLNMKICYIIRYIRMRLLSYY